MAMPLLLLGFKYERKNYKTKLANFVMKVNYSACRLSFVAIYERGAKAPSPLVCSHKHKEELAARRREEGSKLYDSAAMAMSMACSSAGLEYHAPSRLRLLN